MLIPTSSEPHGTEPVLVAGNTTNPSRVLVLLHGRGATAEDIMGVVPQLNLTSEVLVLAPQAAGSAWYPMRFFEPQTANQPFLQAALDRVSTLIEFLELEYHIAPSAVALAGFSQGACVVAEYLKQYPKRYLGAAIWSGGLIGNDEEVIAAVPWSLAGTSVYVGCDEEDAHIPKARVSATAAYLADHDAQVTAALYTNLGHAIHPEGLAFLSELLR